MSDPTRPRGLSAGWPDDGWRERMYRVIFQHHTPGGRVFDVLLMVAICMSVMAVLLESVPRIRARHGAALVAAEWGFTALFTAEYVLRLLCVPRPTKYALSFFGIVDLLAIVPTYAALFLGGAQGLLVIRALRLLRVFRVLKMGEYTSQASLLKDALKRSRPKITVFLVTVLTLVLIVGALMHLIEGEANGFTSIPISIYWAIVTLTTVGYGDIAPQTTLGRAVASAVMIVGYGIIAVPTGIVTAELVRAGYEGAAAARPVPPPPRPCPGCGVAAHDADARHCKYCGAAL
jgi:voltage-gated potassium channel